MRGICRRVLLFILMLGTIFMYQTVFAEENVKKQAKRDAYDLGEVTVTGKKLREPVTSPYAVPESSQIQTEVITAEDIQDLHPATVWDVFEQIPGMEVSYQGRMHIDFGNIRGSGSYGVILDGVYMPTTTRILAMFPTDTIESMIFVRDATALTLGPSTNFGTSTGASNQGFVVIKTKRSSKLEGGLIGSYGTFDTKKAHFYQGSKTGNFDYRLAATYNSTDGKNDWYNASDNRSFLFRGGYTASAFNADILYYHSRGERQFQRGRIMLPDSKGSYALVGTLDNARWKIDPMTYDTIAVNLSKPWSEMQTTTLQYAYSRLLVHSIQDSFKKPSKVTERDQDTYNQNAGLQHIVNWRSNTLKVGGQFLAYRSPDGVAPDFGKRFSERMYSLFVHDEHRMLSDKFTIDGGIRVDRKYYVDSNISGAPMHEWADPTYAYALGASYKLSSFLTLTGRYAYTENSIGDYQVSADGSSLPPEKRSRYEVGILANIHASFNPWVTFYYYDTKNQKVRAKGDDPYKPGVQSVYSYIDPATGDEVNIVGASDVQTQGVEIGISGQIFKPFTYHLSYSYKTSDDGEINSSMAHHTASTRLSYKHKQAFANLSAVYVSGKEKSARSSSAIWGDAYYDLDDYTRVDANVGYNWKIFGRDTRFTLYGRNLGDKHYATRYVTGAYYDPGRQIGVELAVSFF